MLIRHANWVNLVQPYVAPYVEGRHSRLLHLNCLLLAGEYSSKCLGLVIYVLGGFV